MENSNSHRKHSFLICIILIAMVNLNAKAQDTDNTCLPNITVQADSVAWIGSSYAVKYIIQFAETEDSLSSFQLDSSCKDHEYEISYGPSISINKSYSYNNSTIIIKKDETLTIFLNFNKEGVFTLPVLSAQTSTGKKLVSEPLPVVVRKAPAEIGKKAEAIAFSKENDILAIETTINKDHIQLGDSVQFETRLYTNMDILSCLFLSFPIYPAYYKTSEITDDSIHKTVYKDDSVKTVLLYKGSIFPIQSGKVTLNPIEMSFTIAKKIEGVDPLDAFFNSTPSYIERDTVIKANPLTIQVDDKKLPQKSIKLPKTTNTLGIVIDKSLSLKSMPDSTAETYLQLENKCHERLQRALEPSNISVTLFTGVPHYPSTSELQRLESIEPSEHKNGSSVYDAVLAAALRDGALTTESSPYSILLLTDGMDNASKVSERTLINLLQKHNIRVDVITFASRKDSVYVAYGDSLEIVKMNNSQKYDDVERIARQTNGLFFQVEKEEDIPTAIAKIEEKLQRCEKPVQKPEAGFAPDNYMLYMLYKDIWKDAETKF